MSNALGVFLVLGLCVSTGLVLTCRWGRKTAKEGSPLKEAVPCFAPPRTGLTISLVDQAILPSRDATPSRRPRSRFMGKTIR